MRLRAVLLLSLCSGCNALTGASELEPVACTTDCSDASTPADTRVVDTGVVVVETSAPDTTTTMEDSAAICSNGMKDAVESDVDCGGPCAKCVTDKACTTNADCASDQCASGKCARCPAKMALISVGTASYCIDTHEATNAEYKAFLDSTPKTDGQPEYCTWNSTFTPSAWPYLESRATFPVRWVDWCDALGYCKWKGKRLCGKIGGGPSPYSSYADALVSEWYRACSVGGTRAYPYGNTIDYDYCNSRNSGYGSAVHVGSLMSCTSPYATFDMSGNVSEWEDSCNTTSGAMDGCRTRGGSYATLDPRCTVSEVTARQTANDAIGFRCCDD